MENSPMVHDFGQKPIEQIQRIKISPSTSEAQKFDSGKNIFKYYDRNYEPKFEEKMETSDDSSLKRAWKDVRELNSLEFKSLEQESLDFINHINNNAL